jgi:hypothetical protein
MGNPSWQREHHVEIRHRQKLCLALGQPFLCGGALTLGTVPVAARVVGNDGVRALLAALDMAAECRRAAALDRCHHLQLVEADVAGIGRTPRHPVVAKDIRNLQRWTEHCRGRLGRWLHFLTAPFGFSGLLALGL